jgi:hypothetical protein
MELDPQTPPDFPVSTGLEDVVMPTPEPTLLASDLPDRNLTIPLTDVERPVEEVNQVAAALTPETQARVQAALRAIDRNSSVETVHEYNERVKREFTDRVLEARHQAAAPPPPPQPVAPFVMEQTKREMAAGAKQSAYWAAQQAANPRQNPSNKEVAAQGSTTPVFQPASYTHEKGVGFQGKEFTQTRT